MNLLSLKYFISVAEFSSFTKAANHLYVTQPTLSRQIADLEEEVGVQLFSRDKRSVNLTRAGEILLQEAKEIVNRFDNLLILLKNESGKINGSLNVGYLGVFEYDLLIEPISTFGRKYPDVHIGLTRASLAELNHFLIKSKFDLIYTVATGIETLPGVTFDKIANNKMQLIVGNTHPLASKTTVNISELANEHFVMFDRNVSPLTVDSITNMCIENGFSPIVAQYVQDPQTMMLMVSAGKGIGFISSRLSRTYSNTVKFIDILDCHVDFDVVLAYKEDNTNPMLKLFINEVRNLQ